MKRQSPSLVTEKCKAKPQIHTYQKAEGSGGKDVEQLELNTNNNVTLEDSLVVSDKVKNILT